MKKGYCIHYCGIGPGSGGVCNVGHAYLDVARPLTPEEIAWCQENYPDTDPAQTAIVKRIPCNSANSVGGCRDYEEPTPEQIAEYDRQVKEYVNRVVTHISTARPLIVKDIEEQGMVGHTYCGQISCPICGTGIIAYSYAGDVNGHIHATCSKKGCVQWIE